MRQHGDIYLGFRNSDDSNDEKYKICNRLPGHSRCIKKIENNSCPGINKVFGECKSNCTSIRKFLRPLA